MVKQICKLNSQMNKKWINIRLANVYILVTWFHRCGKQYSFFILTIQNTGKKSHHCVCVIQDVFLGWEPDLWVTIESMVIYTISLLKGLCLWNAEVQDLTQLEYILMMYCTKRSYPDHQSFLIAISNRGLITRQGRSWDFVFINCSWQNNQGPYKDRFSQVWGFSC